MKQPVFEERASTKIREFLKEMADIEVIRVKILDLHSSLVCI